MCVKCICHRAVCVSCFQVFVVGLPDSKLHPIFKPSALVGTPSTGAATTGGGAAAKKKSERDTFRSSSNENAVECDLESFNNCPGSANLVACLRSGGNSHASDGNEASGKGNFQSGICACFTHALECFSGDQKACPGRQSIEGAAKAKGCEITRRRPSIDEKVSIISGDSEDQSHGGDSAPLTTAKMSQDLNKVL